MKDTLKAGNDFSTQTEKWSQSVTLGIHLSSEYVFLEWLIMNQIHLIMNSSLTLHWACFSTPAPLNRFSPHQLTQRMAFNHHWRPAWIFIDPGVACETICRVRVLMKISELLSIWTAPRVGLLISNQSFWVCFCDKASYSDWNFSTGATVISISFNIYLNVIPAISNQYTSSAAQTTSCTP